MGAAQPPRAKVGFDAFVLDLCARELRKHGIRIKLQDQPFQILQILLEHPAEVVSRDELQRRLWPADTFVDFEHGLNNAIKRLREALGDSAETPRYIETLSKRGYRFIAPVTNGNRDEAKVEKVSTGAPASDVSERSAPYRRLRIPVLVAAGLAVVVLLLAYAGIKKPPRSQKIRLAVLPFANLTGDPNKEYLADGLTEETISQLGRLNPEQLGVIARTSVMGYKHKDVRLDQIARDLSVQYVLENSLRESGDHLRLTAQLIQVKDQTHLWSQDYDYLAKDILNVQDDVAKAVAREIRVRLTSQQRAELAQLAQPHPVNPEALDAYLRGYHFFEGNTDKNADMAAKYFERATQLDPSYALAWAWLSRARNWQANEGLIPMEEGRRLAREAVERALSLNPNLAEAHAQMGRLKITVDYDWAGANASYQRVVELEPGNPEGVGLAAVSTAELGRFDEAVKLARRAVDFDPLNADSWENLGEIEFYAGQLDQAAADGKKSLELNPDSWGGPILLTRVYLLQGLPQDALREIERVHYAPYRAHLYALTYYALGRKKESDAALSELITKYDASSAFEIATIYAFRNQTDEAFEWLDRAYAQRDPSMMSTKVQPLLNSLHHDPRFAALLKKLNLPN